MGRSDLLLAGELQGFESVVFAVFELGCGRFAGGEGLMGYCRVDGTGGAGMGIGWLLLVVVGGYSLYICFFLIIRGTY